MTSLADLAAMARGYANVERRLFEVLGGWVPTAPEPAVKVLLRTHSFQHAWHAHLWDDLAPRTGPAGSGSGAGEVGAALEAVADRTSSEDRLAGAYGEVLPRLVLAYEGMVRRADPACDGPLVRALGLMLADDERAVSDGESVRRSLVGYNSR